MPRIEVLAERLKKSKIDYEAMAIENPEPEYIWKRRTIMTNNIDAYEEINGKYTLIEMMDGEKFRIDEPYEDFDDRLFLVECEIEIEFTPEEGTVEEETPEKENN